MGGGGDGAAYDRTWKFEAMCAWILDADHHAERGWTVVGFLLLGFL